MLSLYCLVIWCIIRIHLWTNKYVNILINWCCCFQCCCSCHTYCCCCSSWNFLITLGLWWPCTLCNNKFNYHLQISQNNLSAIFVNEMCRLIQTNLRIKTQKHLKPNNKKCLKRQNHQENLITLNMQNAFTLALTYLYAWHVKHTNMHSTYRYLQCRSYTQKCNFHYFKTNIMLISR